MNRGDVHEVRPLKSRGHEQQGRRFGVIIQSDHLLPRSTVIVAPTSTSALHASFRPEITINRERTRVLVDQLVTVDVGRFGKRVGHVSTEEQWALDDALHVVLGL